MTFDALGVRSSTSRILARQGITTPNPVQEEAIPALMAGGDVVIQAPTGSGKTLAFVLPLLEKLAKSDSQTGAPRALIVGPTRELAVQIASVIKGIEPSVSVALIYGGVGYGDQLRALRRRAQIVVGCPGRIVDLANRGDVKFGNIQCLVLDEADEMLDQGFAHDVERIINLTPATRQTVLASATMPEWVQTMIRKHLNDPTHIRVNKDVEPDLEHGLLAVKREQKLDTLNHLLWRHQGQAIVFHRTKHGAKKLTRDLDGLGHIVCELQGNLSQNARDKSINMFRRGDANVLVATNVAARGLDVSGVSLVVNYELPDTPQWLTHRVGRTARNGESGRAITFLTDEDSAQWTKLKRLGAPHVHHVDPAKLLDDQEWHPLPEAAAPSGRGQGRGRTSTPMATHRVFPHSPRSSAPRQDQDAPARDRNSQPDRRPFRSTYKPSSPDQHRSDSGRPSSNDRDDRPARWSDNGNSRDRNGRGGERPQYRSGAVDSRSRPSEERSSGTSRGDFGRNRNDHSTPRSTEGRSTDQNGRGTRDGSPQGRRDASPYGRRDGRPTQWSDRSSNPSRDGRGSGESGSRPRRGSYEARGEDGRPMTPGRPRNDSAGPASSGRDDRTPYRGHGRGRDAGAASSRPPYRGDRSGARRSDFRRNATAD